MAISNPPQGYHSLTPYLIVADPVAAWDFYTRAFDARPVMKLMMPGKGGVETIAHGEMQIGNSRFMLSGEWPGMDALSPASRGGATTSFLIYVADAEAGFQKALAAGAEQVRPVEVQFHGDRSGMVKDPSGHVWTIATRVEDVDEAEAQRRARAAMTKG